MERGRQQGILDRQVRGQAHCGRRGRFPGLRGQLREGGGGLREADRAGPCRRLAAKGVEVPAAHRDAVGVRRPGGGPRDASMGPPSGNGGYARKEAKIAARVKLQWVHRPVTVVMLTRADWATATPAASMGPPSGNGGYGPSASPACSRRAASMGPPSGNGGYAGGVRKSGPGILASMGPPSGNGGYDQTGSWSDSSSWCFNGSTVR